MAPLIAAPKSPSEIESSGQPGMSCSGPSWTLLLKDNNAGQWKADTFLVDSGTEMTTMPAWLAKKMDLPMPRKAAAGAIHKQTGLEIRAGLLRARIIGLDGTEFTFPCFFLGDPDAPPKNLPGSTG